MTTVTNQDFAREVKSDRLRVLYRITLLICAFAILMIVSFSTTTSSTSSDSISTTTVVIAIGTLALGCLFTHALLNHERFEFAAWAYALGGVAAVGVLLRGGDATSAQTVPFILPVIVFLVGLLLSPRHTFLMAVVAVGTILFAPLLGLGGAVEITAHQAVAIFLIFVSMMLAIQVSGELYQITEWALSHYQRERRVNDELFEKRQALQLSLRRSEHLSTELKTKNIELEVAREAAEKAKEFRGKFLANMSHELRTPLNAIIGFSETMLKFPMMYDNKTLPTPYATDMNQIYHSGRQLLHVINDILDLAKVDAGKLDVHMQAVKLEPIIEAVIATSKGLLGSKPVELKKTVPNPLPVVWADEARLRQVLVNLYSNAAKYTDVGEIELTIRVIGDKVHFLVRDTGTGISELFHEAIFDEYQQAEATRFDSRSGTGLGLPISRQLLTLMGGTIGVESKPTIGSTFFFIVQLYSNQDQLAQAPAKDLSDTIPLRDSVIPDSGGAG